jgi:formylglycine-generating enzyme required for sulfatase activity
MCAAIRKTAIPDSVQRRLGCDSAGRLHAWARQVPNLLLALIVAGLAGCGSDESVTTATLVIETTPVSGAEITVNGRACGKSPITVPGLPAGGVLIEAALEKYEDVWRALEVDEGTEEQVLLELKPLVGTLNLRSEPPGARVMLDGIRELGVTPLEACEIPIGYHTYTVSLADHETSTGEIAIETNSRYTRVYELTPMMAAVQIFSYPAGADIYVNNRLQQMRSPARLQVSPGIYIIGVHAQGYVMAEALVELGANESREIQLKMEEGDAPLGMLLVPAGEFVMGADDASPDERPRGTVSLDAFYIDKYEITNEQFKAVFPTHIYGANQDNYPVTGVTWHQAAAYATKVGKRLPTEKEWEKAARGTDGRAYPWGAMFDRTLCNVATSALPAIKPVGRYFGGASPCGCMDMAGNAYEWTSDWYDAYPGNRDVEKEYGQVYRVLRGGSYSTGPFDARCVKRHYDLMDTKRDDYGFRCVKDVSR